MENEEVHQIPPAPHDDASHIAERNGDSGGEPIGSAAIRPVFLGNLRPNYVAGDIQDIFSRPIPPPHTPEGTYMPIAVDRIDLKRGYCFVFLKDAGSQAEKDMAERFVSAINGM